MASGPQVPTPRIVIAPSPCSSENAASTLPRIASSWDRYRFERQDLERGERGRDLVAAQDAATVARGEHLDRHVLGVEAIRPAEVDEGVSTSPATSAVAARAITRQDASTIRLLVTSHLVLCLSFARGGYRAVRRAEQLIRDDRWGRPRPDGAP
jgi:hypothetical protein